MNLIEHGDRHWVVSALLTREELVSTEKSLHILHGLKVELAEYFEIPVEILEFDRIVHRESVGENVQVAFRIIQLPVQQGEPEIRILPEVGPDGFEYPDMSAYLSIYFLTSFNKKITFDWILHRAHQAGVSSKALDAKACSDALKECCETHEPVFDRRIATGQFPDPGQDAVVEFVIPVAPEAGNIDSYVSSKRVSTGDYICHKAHPRPGRYPGVDVRGKKITPSVGMDIDLIAEEGVLSTSFSQSLRAGRSGVVEVKRTVRKMYTATGEKIVPVAIRVCVKPVKVVDASEVLNITTDEAIEINGTVRFGSVIIANSDVFINGTVEAESSIHAGKDIVVTGQVFGSKLSSQENTIVRGDVENSHVVAREAVHISGAAVHSNVTGKTVDIDTVQGSKVTANRSATIRNIKADESNILSSFIIGMKEFYVERVKENRETIQKLESTIDRMKEIFGDEIVNSISESSVQIMFIRHLSALHRATGNEQLQRSDLERRKQLLGAIPMLHQQLTERNEENDELEQRLSEQCDDSESVLVVREKISGQTEVKVGGRTHDVATGSGGTFTAK